MSAEWDVCQESVSRSHDTDRAGYCCWCRRRVDPPMPKPPPERTQSRLTLAYRYFYDPDFGTSNDDSY